MPRARAFFGNRKSPSINRSEIAKDIAMQEEQLGHKTKSVFERYNIIATTDLFEAVRKLETHDSQRFQRKTGGGGCVRAGMGRAGLYK
jgi:hypothetical protein